jgi:hypothetical protein
MANDEHLSILMQGTIIWNRWRNKHPEIEPDLSKSQYLIGLDISDVDFSKVNLRAAFLLLLKMAASFTYPGPTRAPAVRN